MRVSQFLIVIPVLAEILLILAVATAALIARAFAAPTTEVKAAPGHGSRDWDTAYRERLGLPLVFLATALLVYGLRLVDERVLFLASLFFVADLAAAGLRLFAFDARGADRRVAVAQIVGLSAIAALAVIVGLHFVHAGF